MKVVYFSLTGNVRRFVEKLGFPAIELNQTNPFLKISEPFVLIAPSYEKDVTDILWDFMDTNQNHTYCKGVVGSGNLNFDSLFAYTAKELSYDFDVPFLWAFESFGTERDINHVKEQLHAIADIDCTDDKSDLF